MLVLAVAALLLQAAQPVAAQPGAAQGIVYRIEARLDESTHILEGRAELEYTNRSGGTIDTLYFHQHLNAFRPNSAWARREVTFGETRFQRLGADEHAFERLTRVEVDGRPARPVYPGAPDSTVVGIPLPQRLPAGGRVVVRLDWTARLATTPRRQGRAGRHYDWAHWYPRIAVYEDGAWQTQPLLPQGEFYGEFGSYDVTLEVAADQVLGATGVPVEGDPGWARAARAPGTAIPNMADAYSAEPARPLGLLTPGATAADRKRVRWRAERVHHFAWSADPSFVYEGGSVPRADGAGDSIAIHVLYGPNDATWADGIVLQRTIRALQWMQDRFGPYGWPQLTNLHRIEAGGTEFPMLLMNGSSSEGLIVHEVAHQYLHGILANNEFREAWLDEGFASYLTNRYHEEQGRDSVWQASLEAARARERAGATEPIALPAAEFTDYATYGAMSYTKAELVFRMLEALIGEDRMKSVLRTFFSRHAYSHVTGDEFAAVVNEVTGEDFSWFFEQWIERRDRLDYRVEEAVTSPVSDGRWRSRVRVRRAGEAWMPVTLQVGTARVVLSSRDEVQEVEIVTMERPQEAVLDPDEVLLDMNVQNNRRRVSGP